MKTIEVTDATVASILSQHETVLLDFGAEWCGPCQMMAPVVDQLASEFDGLAVVGKLDIDQNPKTAAAFGVRNFPTFLFFRNGRLIDRMIGAVPKATLAQKVRNLLQD